MSSHDKKTNQGKINFLPIIGMGVCIPKSVQGRDSISGANI